MKGRKRDPESITKKPTSAGRCPSAPSWLPYHAGQEWKRAARVLHDRGHLTPGVFANLEAYCIAVDLVRSASEILQIEGRTIETKTGQKMHPEFRVLTQGLRDVRLLGAELGLTPFRQPAENEQFRDDRAGDSDLYA